MKVKLLKKIMFASKQMFYIFLLNLITLQLVNANESKSQSIEQVKVFLDMKDAGLSEIFSAIEAQTDFVFIYDTNVLDSKNECTLRCKKIVSEILQDIATDYNLKFRQINTTVFVKKSNEILPVANKIEKSIQPQRAISGRVSSSKGEPLPGVSVVVKGTNIGIVTNSSGEFSLNIPDNAKILQFSFIGMKTQEVEIANQTSFSIIMEDQTIGMDEIVVTALGIEKSKRSLTYATQEVNVDDLSTVSKGNVIAALAGKVAGVAVMTWSTGGSRIIIRGERSINGSNTPLIITDGVPSSTGLSNVDNIESINVLKGPSASALYGSAAANGVIIITTKKGATGKSKIEINSQTLIGIPYLFPEMQNVYGQGENGNYNPSTDYYSWGPKMKGQTLTNWTGKDIKFLPQPDNIKDLFRNSYRLNNSFSYSTGNDKSTVLLSYKNAIIKGLVPVNSSTSHIINMRVGTELIKDLKLDAILNWTHSINKNVSEAGDDLFSPMWQLVKMPRSIRTQDIEDAYYYDSSGSKKQLGWNTESTANVNPYWSMKGWENAIINNNISAVASLRYDFTDWLYLQGRGHMSFSNGDNEYKYYWDTPHVCSGKGKYALSYSKSHMLDADILLGIDKKFNNDWNLTVNFGAEIKDNKSSGIDSETGEGGLVIENKFYLGNGSTVNTSNHASHKQTQSVYGTAQVGFRNYLFLDITARNDWNSTLPSPFSYFYPSAGLTCVISDMLKLPEAFSYLKIRGSYAEVGNGAGFAQIYQTYSRSLNGTQGQVQPGTTKVASDLIPEKTKAWETGLEVRMLNDKFGVDFSGYKTNTYNQLVKVTTGLSSGYSRAYINCGNIQNKGIEIMLNAVPVQTALLKWNIGLNFSRNWSKVIELTESLDYYELNSPSKSMGDSYIIVDKPYGEILSRGFKRNNEGRIIVDDIGMPSVTSEDYEEEIDLGNFNYDFRGGLTCSLQYKNWNLYFLIDLNYGGIRQSATEAQMLLSGTSKETLYGRDGFIVDGVREITDTEGNVTDYVENNIEIDAETYGKAMGGRASSGCGELFTHKATNSRLRELSIGYKVPVKNSLINSLTVSAVGKNLFYFYNACAWFDPDMTYDLGSNGQGSESAFLPGTRTIGLNIKLTL